MFISKSDLDRFGVCKNKKGRECTVFCSDFIKSKCPGVRYMRTEDGRYIDQDRYPFKGYVSLRAEKNG